MIGPGGDARYDVVVLGAGVIGLSCAIELARLGLQVAIVARDLPHDLESTDFASPWAGCNWSSFEVDGSGAAARWDAVTFRHLQRLSREHPELCSLARFLTVSPESKELPWYADLTSMRRVQHSESSPLPAQFPHGLEHASYTINAPAYLSHLGKQAAEAGIPFIRRRVESIDEAYNLPGVGRVGLVVNCTGLGAAQLRGVEDDKVFPARGLTILVRAPLVKRCIMYTDGFTAGGEKRNDTNIVGPAYIIPRPGTDGQVVLGGTYVKNDYSCEPDTIEAERILKDCFALEPLLAGPVDERKSWTDIEVIRQQVGSRPAREGGARVEYEQLPDVDVETGDCGIGREGLRGLIHAYGFGGTGYQASIGVAQEVGHLATKHLSKGTKSQ